MKNFSFLILTAMTLTLVACGNKDKSGGGSSKHFSSDPYKVQTLTGYVNLQQPTVKVGDRIYQVSQQSYPVMNQGIMLAQQQNIQPVLVSGVYMYKAKITGSLGSNYMGGYQQYPQQGTGNVLNVTQIVIYR